MNDKHLPLLPHELMYLAKDLNHGIRQLLGKVDALREELHLASRVAKLERRHRRQRPVCGARKESGGICLTPLEPGQFRCDLHARETSKRRSGDRQSRGDVPGDE